MGRKPKYTKETKIKALTRIQFKKLTFNNVEHLDL